MKLKVGDRVEAIVDHIERNSVLLKGDTGTVCKLYGSGGSYGVGIEWDRPCGGHGCDGHCEYGYGWNVNKKDIRLIQSVETHDVKVDNSDLFTMLAIGGACL